MCAEHLHTLEVTNMVKVRHSQTMLCKILCNEHLNYWNLHKELQWNKCNYCHMFKLLYMGFRPRSESKSHDWRFTANWKHRFQQVSSVACVNFCRGNVFWSPWKRVYPSFWLPEDMSQYLYVFCCYWRIWRIMLSWASAENVVPDSWNPNKLGPLCPR